MSEYFELRNFNILKIFDGFKQSWRIYSDHLDRMIQPYQGILQDRNILERIKVSGYRKDYIFPTILAGGIIMDIIIHYLIYGYDRKRLIFYHHIMFRSLPDFFKAQSDIVFGALFFLVFLCHFYLVFDKMLHTPFIMFETKGPGENSAKLVFPYRKRNLALVGKSLSKKLIEFYTRISRRNRLIVTILSIQVNFGCSVAPCMKDVNDYLEGKYQFDLHVIICAITSLFYFRDLVTVIHIGIQFMCQNSLIQIKQKHYLLKLKMEELFFKHRNHNEAFVYQRGYFNCMENLGKILDITREIDGFNRFYSKYVTTIILLFGLAGCSTTLPVIQKFDEAPFIQMTPWIVYGTIYFSFVFFFNAFSSRTIYLNFRLFKRMRQVQIKLLSKRYLNIVHIVKLDLVNEYKIFLQKCSFKLSNSSSINNRLFAFTIFGCISVFYMRIIKDGKSDGLALNMEKL